MEFMTIRINKALEPYNILEDQIDFLLLNHNFIFNFD